MRKYTGLLAILLTGGLISWILHQYNIPWEGGLLGAVLAAIIGAGMQDYWEQDRKKREEQEQRKRRYRLIKALETELRAIQITLESDCATGGWLNPGEPYLGELAFEENYFTVFERSAGRLELLPDDTIIKVVHAYQAIKHLQDQGRIFSSNSLRLLSWCEKKQEQTSLFFDFSRLLGMADTDGDIELEDKVREMESFRIHLIDTHGEEAQKAVKAALQALEHSR